MMHKHRLAHRRLWPWLAVALAGLFVAALVLRAPPATSALLPAPQERAP